jgi:hypothetical protein
MSCSTNSPKHRRFSKKRGKSCDSRDPQRVRRRRRSDQVSACRQWPKRDTIRALKQFEMTLLRLAARAMRGLMLHQLGFDIAPERRRLENAQAAAAITSASGRRSMLCIQEEPTEVMRPNARKMAGSDPRPSVRIAFHFGARPCCNDVPRALV